jgi:hypothetical protein
VPTTDGLPDLDAPEFAPIKARLARLYLSHKADLGVAYRDDADIADKVDDITWLLLDRLGRAFLARDDAWLQRGRWFVAIVEDLLGDQPDRLDG